MNLEFSSLNFSPNKPYNLVFIHGFMGDGFDFWCLANALLEASQPNINIFLLHLPFHLRKYNKFNHLNWGRYIDLLDGFISTLPNKTVLYGYSMGGRIALSYVCKYPSRVKGLILESSGFGIESNLEKERRRIKDENLIPKSFLGKPDFNNPDGRAFLRSWFENSIFLDIEKSQDFPKLLEKRYRKNPRGIQKALNIFSVCKMNLNLSDLKKIKTPILYLAGKKDNKYLGTSLKIKNLDQGILIKTIDGASHNCHLMNLPVVSESILDFINRT